MNNACCIQFHATLAAKNRDCKRIQGPKSNTNLDDEIFCIGPCHVGAAARSPGVGSIVHLLAEGGQRIEAAICLHPNITATAPIPACWPTYQCTASLTITITRMMLIITLITLTIMNENDSHSDYGCDNDNDHAFQLMVS